MNNATVGSFSYKASFAINWVLLNLNYKMPNIAWPGLSKLIDIFVQVEVNAKINLVKFTITLTFSWLNNILP